MKKKILKLTVSLIISIGVYNVYCIKQTENNSQMSTLMIANHYCPVKNGNWSLK